MPIGLLFKLLLPPTAALVLPLSAQDLKRLTDGITLPPVSNLLQPGVRIHTHGWMNPERGKLNQVLQNFFSKCAQVIVQSRQAPTGAAVAKPNKWFNLEMEEREGVRDDLRAWRNADPADIPPLIVETYVSAKGIGARQRMILTDQAGKGWPCDKPEVVLERWVIEFRAASGTSIEVPVIYKRAIIAVRVLYSLTRLLPAHSLRRRLSRQKLTQSQLEINYRIVDGTQHISSRGRIGLSKRIIEPTAQSANSPPVLQTYHMTPIETPGGSLHVSVSYRTDVSFKTDDAESVMAQQFLDLDAALEAPTQTGERHKPVVSFTRPFRSPDAGSTHSLVSAASVSSHTPYFATRRTPSASSVSLSQGPAASSLGTGVTVAGSASGSGSTGAVTGSAGVMPVPVPGGIQRDFPLASSAGSTSSMPRFSSSFASRGSVVPRSASIESRHRPLSTAGSISSTNSSVEPGSGLYMPQPEVGEFVKFVDDAQKRATSAFKSARSVGDNTLAKFQNLRASHVQLSDSMAGSIAGSVASGSGATHSPDTYYRRQGSVGSAVGSDGSAGSAPSPVPEHSTIPSRRLSSYSGSTPRSRSASLHRSREPSVAGSLEPKSRSAAGPTRSPTPPPAPALPSLADPPEAAPLSPVESPGGAKYPSSSIPRHTVFRQGEFSSSATNIETPRSPSQSYPPTSGSYPNTSTGSGSLSRYSHVPATPSRLSKEYTATRTTVLERPEAYDGLESNKSDEPAIKHDSDDELLFALSDMNTL